MAEIVGQLESVRTRARRLLVLMRLAGWATALIGAVIVAGLFDYMIHLPGAARLVILVIAAILATAWGVRTIGRSARAHPGLTSLALRLERLYPETSGRLATGVAFTVDPQQAGPSAISHDLAQRSADAAADALDGERVQALIDRTRPGRALACLAISAAVFAGFALFAPEATGIALRRWAMPLGDTQWPRRTVLENHTTITMAPSDQPLPVRVRVVKGDRESLRVWVSYRFVDRDPGADHPWQRALMTLQANAETPGLYQRLLEPETGASAVELYFHADDDRTDVQGITLIDPPQLRQLRVQVNPPDYASDLIPVRAHDLLHPPRPTVTVEELAGSRITLTVQTNQPLPLPDVSQPTGVEDPRIEQFLRRSLIGLTDDLDDDALRRLQIQFDPLPDQPTQWQVRWTHQRSATVQLAMTDEHDLQHIDARHFRFLVRQDVSPQVSVVDPPADEHVLATAVIPVAAEAQDDVAITQVRLEARPGEADAQPLADVSTRQPRASAGATLELEPLALQPGDTVLIVATAVDGFDMDGQRHEPVESRPRRLTVIRPDDLVQQIRAEMASVRQRAVRAEAVQAQLETSAADVDHAPKQQRLADQIGSIQRTVEAMRDRMHRNRLEDDALQQLVDRSGEMLDAAHGASDRAAAAMRAADTEEDAAAEARGEQRATRDRLGELIDLLDQGRAAFRIRQQLNKLKTDQQQLLDSANELVPRTLGKSPDELSAADREALSQLADAQQQLSDVADQLTDELRNASDRIAREAESPDDEALAEALREAALIALRQGLTDQMRQASESASQNQLSSATSDQAGSLQTIQEMLDQLGALDKKRQEMLRRRLEDLVQAIERLVKQQTAQLDRLVAVQTYDDLDEPLMQLRRNTLAVAEQARQADPTTVPVATHLDAAAEHQQQGVVALRAEPVAPDDAETAERAALDRLLQALELARELAEQARDDQKEQEREELIKAYKAALAEQTIIAEATLGLVETAEDDRDRKWRVGSINLSHRQTDLRLELQRIAALVADTIVFASMHQEMDEWIDRIAFELRGPEPGEQTLFAEQLVISAIESLLEALKQERPDSPFAEGGGGGGGGGQTQLIPPTAELKLLRERQKVLYRMTRHLHARGPLNESGRDLLETLADQQRRLAETTGAVAETMRSDNRAIRNVDRLDVGDSGRVGESDELP